jgi:hypothetical protein
MDLVPLILLAPIGTDVAAFCGQKSGAERGAGLEHCAKKWVPVFSQEQGSPLLEPMTVFRIRTVPSECDVI